MRTRLFILIIILNYSSLSSAQNIQAEGGSAFQFGFARIEAKRPADTTLSSKQQDTSYASHINANAVYEAATPLSDKQQFYIDTNGQIAFNHILKGGFLSRSEWEMPDDSTVLPQHYFILVEKQKKLGILTSDGHWLLHPIYDDIDTRDPMGWIVKKDGYLSIYTTKGFALPFQFEQVWQMDSNYYNVVQHGKWGVYSKKDKKLVIPCLYQDMDYCYGCSYKGDYVFAQKDGKWGIVDIHNKVLIPFKYEHQHSNMTSGNMVYALYHNETPLRINLNTGNVDTCNCSPIQDGDSTALGNGFILVEKNQQYGLLNPAGKQILDYKYTQIRYETDSDWVYMPAPYFQICTENGWGVSDSTGKILLPAKYDQITMTGQDSLLVVTGKINDVYQQQLFELKGQLVIPGYYSDIKAAVTDKNIDSPAISYYRLENKDQFGLYNPHSKLLIQPQYEQIQDFQFYTKFPHAAVLKKSGLQGILDINTGNVIIEPSFNSIETDNLPSGLALVDKNNTYGLFDYLHQKMVIPLQAHSMYLTDNHTSLLVKNNQKFGLKDFKGHIMVDTIYDEIHSLNDSLYVLMTRDSAYQQHYRFFNSNTHRFYLAPADTLNGVYSDTLAILVKNGQYELYSPSKDQIIMGAYNKEQDPIIIGPFQDGKAIFYNRDHKAGILTANGHIFIPAIYDGIGPFNHGYAIVLQGQTKEGQQLYGFIDSTGKLIIPAKYTFDHHYRLVGDYFLGPYLILLDQAPSGKYLMGLANKKGQQIIPPYYNQVIPEKSGNYFLLKKNGLFGIADSLGKIILPVTFKDIGLDNWTGFNQQYEFSFPVIAEKEAIWQYYKKDGTTLPVTAKEHIPFNAPVF